MCDFLKVKALVHSISKLESKTNLGFQKENNTSFVSEIKCLAFHIVAERMRGLAKANPQSASLYHDLFTSIVFVEMQKIL